jgi:hypothetical protein
MQREIIKQNGLDAIRLQADDLSLAIIPDLGGKISSIEWNQRQILALNPLKPLRLARYAAPYSDYDASGFDECLPTIGACRYPEAPFAGIEAPDHGELWSIKWSESSVEDGLHLRVDGVRFPYTFHRWITFPASRSIHFRYALSNRSADPFKFIWSAHPLLAIQPGMRILLPEGVGIRLDWSKGGRLGELLDEHPWPFSEDREGRPVDLSQILPASTGFVDKLYTTRLEQGWCALHDGESGFYVAMLFNPAQIPYVGLSINLGGWPVEGPGYYNLGLEPCNGYPDRLDIAIERGDCVTVPPESSLSWEWSLLVGQAEDFRTELARLQQRYAEFINPL